MDYKIAEERMNISSDISNINRHKVNAATYSVLATIREINLKEFTCTVFIPASSTLIAGVIIANSPFSNNSVGLNMIPSVGQKCIVLLGQQHNPILVSTIPNTLKENDGRLLNGEYKLGNESEFIKQNVAGDLLIKTSATVDIKDESGSSSYAKSYKFSDQSFEIDIHRTNGISSMKEVFYKSKIKRAFRKKSEIIKDGVLNKEIALDIETNLNTSLDRALEFFQKVEGINSIVSERGIEAVNEMKPYILNEEIDKNTFLEIQKGDNEYNIQSNSIYSLKYVEAGMDILDIKCKKDGIIEINCKDMIVNKKGI